MRFNLEPGDTFHSDRYKPVAVKINDAKKISLPTKAYYIDSFHNFIIYHCAGSSSYRVNSSFQNIRLMVEKVKGDYKLALVSSFHGAYFFYVSDNLVDVYISSRSTNNSTLVGNRVLIDLIDIISSENIIPILDLEWLERYNGTLEIQIGKKSAPEGNHNINIYNPFTDRVIGIMNNIVPCFFELGSRPYQIYELMLHTSYSTNELGRGNSYFTVKKLGNNYVGCMSYKNGTCKNFYELSLDFLWY